MDHHGDGDGDYKFATFDKSEIVQATRPAS